MSLGNIKAELETYLDDNLTNVAIKWSNSDTYTKGGSVLSATEISNLTLFIEPMIIPLSDKKEVISGVVGYKNKVIFQISVYGKKNKGMGSIISNADISKALYKEKTINGVVCESSEYLPYYDFGEWVVLPVSINAFKRFA